MNNWLKIRKAHGKKRPPLNLYSTKQQALEALECIQLEHSRPQKKASAGPHYSKLIQGLDQLSYPHPELLVGLQHTQDYWVEIKRNKLTRYSFLGKERSLQENAELRKKFILKLREIRGRKAHAYTLRQLKKERNSYRPAPPAAGTRSTRGENTLIDGASSPSFARS